MWFSLRSSRSSRTSRLNNGGRCVDSSRDFLFEDRLPLLERSAHAAAGRVLVAAAAELLCHGVDVDIALRPQADAPVGVRVLLEKHDRQHFLRREREIDE